MTTPTPDLPLATTAVDMEEVPSATALREPNGYRAKYFFASIGLFLAIFAPGLGGMAVKIQSLVPLEEAGTALGIVTGIGGLFAIVTQPLIGRLSDRTTSRWGMRKPWIVVGTVGTFLSLLVIPLAPSVAVVAMGWSGAQLFVNVAQAGLTATIADQVPERRRGRVSGLVGATAPIGIVLGAFGLTLLPTDLLRMGIPAVIGLVAGLVFALTLKDRVLKSRPARFNVKEFFAAFVFNPVKYRDLGWAWLTKAMFVFGYASIVTYLPLYLATNFGMTAPGDQLQFNLYCTIVMTVFNVAFALIGGVWSDRVGKRRVFVTWGAVITSSGVALFAIAPTFGISAGLVALLVGQALIGMGGGLFLAVDMALCIEVLPDKNQIAKDLGILNIANLLPVAFAPFFAGIIFIPLGDSLFGAGYATWFLAAAAVSFAGGLLVYRIKGVR
ncbi:MFS transporter [Microbacterium sp. LWH3-1.2]|uniref:MFS transporter n=1 Tax=Microbacterium sp. LWH3-1.2 TaxID=3135256 RepID=UPI003447B562